MILINEGIAQKLLDAVATGAQNSDAFSLPTKATQLTWQTSFGVAPASITVQLQTSLDNLTWSTIDTSTSVAGEDRTIATSALFIRARINAISGGSAITVQLVCKTGFIGLTTPSSVTDGSLALFDGTTGSKFKELLFPGGTTTFLRADGTFAAAGGGSAASPVNSIQFNSAGLFGGFGVWDGSRFSTLSTGGLSLLSGGAPGTYSASNSGIIMYDSSGNEVWRLWTGDPDDQNNYNSGNAYFGYHAGFSQPSDNSSAGYNNVGIGAKSLESITTGYYNTGVGVYTLISLVDGHNNSAFGVDALQSVTSGVGNLGFGSRAGNDLTTESNVACIGYQAGEHLTGVSNIIIFGNAFVTDVYFGEIGAAAKSHASAYYIGNTAGIDASITTGALVGKTITVSKGIITGFA